MMQIIDLSNCLYATPCLDALPTIYKECHKNVLFDGVIGLYTKVWFSNFTLIDNH